MLSKKILVVDDECDVRETLSEVFELNGFTAVTASNGLEALERLEEGHGRPDLILLDLMMPFMNGAEFIKAKDLRPEFAGIPVIAFSADGHGAEKIEGLRVSDFLKKPIQLHELISAVRKYILNGQEG